MWQQYQMQGLQSRQHPMRDLKGEPLMIPLPDRQLLLFWATWCGPCKVEMARIKRLVENGSVDGAKIIAISLGEDEQTVKQFLQENPFPFRFVFDFENSAQKFYKVQVTPTLILVDEDQKIHWMTSGLSPSLELRLSTFL